MGILLTPEFRAALANIAKLRQMRSPQEVVFIEGGAGTGKSTLIRRLQQDYPDALVAAPTGVAATLLGGVSVHRLMGFPLKVLEPERDYQSSHPNKVLRKARMLIIDEVGMVRADMVDGLDYYLRRMRRRDTPFGGITLVLVGDPWQLPPVLRTEEHEILTERLGYRSRHFFDAKVWDHVPLRTYSLTHVFRQENKAFVDILRRLRTGSATQEDMTTLNRRAGQPVPANTVTLTTTRLAASRINEQALARNPNKPVMCDGVITGQFREEDAPAERRLVMKPGNLVMLLNNTESWSNGTTGIFQGMNREGMLLVREESGIEHEVSPHTWERKTYSWNEREGCIEQKLTGTFLQYPVRMAHGVTIHKSQGQTLDRASIDLGWGAFDAGQTYVALSRVKSLEGLYLRRAIRREDCIVDERVREAMGAGIGEAPLPAVNQSELTLFASP